jgi:hypothetical protein
MGGFWILLGFVVFGTVAISSQLWILRRSKKVLREWAAQQGLELMQIERPTWNRGPFGYASSAAQVVFRVMVRATDGRQRTGYVCVGGYFRGVSSNEVKAVWDDEK